MQFPSAMTHVEIEAIVDGVRRRHGHAGLLALAEIVHRELSADVPGSNVWSARPSLVGS